METMKKQWGKALVGVQEFVPSEYVAVCPPSETYFEYKFWCDAGSANSWQRVWLDKAPLHSFGDEDNPRLGYYHACKKTHVVKIKKSEYPNPEAYLETIFPYGWLEDADTYDYWTGNMEINQVRIWRGEDGDNIHCTYNLKQSSWTEKNPS